MTKAHRAKLVVVGQAGAGVCPVSDEGCLIGSAPGAPGALRLPTAGVAPRHARIRAREGGHRIERVDGEDLRVNGERVRSADLYSFDRIELGEYSLVYLDADTDARKVLALLSPQSLSSTMSLKGRGSRLQEELVSLILVLQQLGELEESAGGARPLDATLRELVELVGAGSAALVLETRGRVQALSRFGSPTWLPGEVGGLLRLALEEDRAVEQELEQGGRCLCVPVRGGARTNGNERRRRRPESVRGALIFDALPSALELPGPDLRLLEALGRQIGLLLTNARLHRKATRDPITELLNRAGTQEALTAELERAGEGRPLAIALLDVDDFKQINDTQGHDAGDEALRQLGALLREEVRRQDVVGRWGGEEFLAILPETRLEEAKGMVERLVRRVRAGVRVGERRVTISAGVAAIPEHGTPGRDTPRVRALGPGISEPGTPARESSAEALLRCADLALYAAKRAGKDRALVYSPELAASGPAPGRPASAQVDAEGPRAIAWLLSDLHAPIGLEPGVALLGRSDACTAVLPHPSVSRRHAMVVVSSDGHMVVEDRSTNGTQLNGETLRGRSPLRQGDRLKIGPFEFEVVATQRRESETWFDWR
ncbi:MAG: diguanylate cyclase [Planctomycetota bacterium]